MSTLRRPLWFLSIPLAFGLSALAVLLFHLTSLTPVAEAAGNVCYAKSTISIIPYTSTDASALRDAILFADDGEVIQIAGTCAGAVNENGSDQVAYIDKKLTLAGGYTSTNWTTAYPLTQPTTLDGEGGGRVIVAYAEVILQDFTIKNGQVSDDVGGGLYADVAISLTGVTFYNNLATGSGNGGGAYFNASVALTNTTFMSNSAGTYGGAYFKDQGTLAQLTSVTFISNTAGSQGGGAGFDGSAVLTNTTFMSNTAGDKGGGAVFNGVPILFDTTFTNNSATTSGGGAFFDGFLAVLSNTTFTRNTAGEDGGGFYLSDSSLAFLWHNTTFINNTATNNGGGAFMSAKPAGENTTFIGNRAALGGALYLTGTQQTIDFYNALLVGNTANKGAGLYVAGDTLLKIMFTTITSPTLASGAAIYSEVSSDLFEVQILNSIIASHTVGLENSSGIIGTFSENYNLFDTVTKPYSGSVAAGANSFTGTAAFTDTVNNDYGLSLNSDALDVLPPYDCATAYNKDLRDVLRPQNFYCELGALEFVNASPMAQDDGYITAAGQALTVAAAGVLSNDSDADQHPLTANLLSTTVNGVLTFNSNGSFRYTPTVGFAGVDLFTYQVTDSHLSDSATVSITVGSTTVPNDLFYGPGWNLFGWPLQASATVTAGLMSITGTYQTVYHYDAQAPGWEIYDVSLPPQLNTLSTLTFGEAYWITVTQDVTLTLSTLTGTAPSAPQAALPMPPATYYGRLFGISANFAPLTVYIGDTLCGMARANAGWYLVHVTGADEKAGCGQAGVTLLFKQNGQIIATQPWRGSGLNMLDFYLWQVTAQRLFLPLISR